MLARPLADNFRRGLLPLLPRYGCNAIAPRAPILRVSFDRLDLHYVQKFKGVLL